MIRGPCFGGALFACRNFLGKSFEKCLTLCRMGCIIRASDKERASKIEEGTKMTNYITVESFGSEIPANWEQIATYLNEIIDRRGIAEDHAAVNELWESYWNGEIPGAPEAE